MMAMKSFITINYRAMHQFHHLLINLKNPLAFFIWSSKVFTEKIHVIVLNGQ